jgi:hypothetical protein
MDGADHDLHEDREASSPLVHINDALRDNIDTLEAVAAKLRA